MKKINQNYLKVTILLAIAFVTLLSFTSRWGGESFTIYLNDKLLLQQSMHDDRAIKPIELKKSNYNDELRISFSHCGVAGKKKTITIKDQNDNVLKQWNFSDVNASMTCKVKDILSLEKKNTTLQLIYTSAERPKGRVLASIVTENMNTVKK